MTTPFDTARTAGLDCLISMPLVDAAGGAVVPTSAEMRVLDEAEQPLLDWSAVVVPPGPAADVTVPAVFNTLPEGEIYGMRTVELRIQHLGGELLLASTYALAGARKLIPMVNSYGTMQQLEVAAMYTPEGEVMHFTGASADERIRALLVAYQAIEALPLMVVTDKGVELCMLREMNAATRLLKVEPQMRRALLQAQLLHAAHTLGLPGDAIAQARLNGVISMTVGESSQFWGSRPLELTVVKSAMRLLGRYLRRSVKIGRA